MESVLAKRFNQAHESNTSTDGTTIREKFLEHKTQVNIYKRTNVMQLGSMFICKCNIALHVLDAFCVHLQEHLEIVEAASGE